MKSKLPNGRRKAADKICGMAVVLIKKIRLMGKLLRVLVDFQVYSWYNYFGYL